MSSMRWLRPCQKCHAIHVWLPHSDGLGAWECKPTEQRMHGVCPAKDPAGHTSFQMRTQQGHSPTLLVPIKGAYATCCFSAWFTSNVACTSAVLAHPIAGLPAVPAHAEGHPHLQRRRSLT